MKPYQFSKCNSCGRILHPDEVCYLCKPEILKSNNRLTKGPVRKSRNATNLRKSSHVSITR